MNHYEAGYQIIHNNDINDDNFINNTNKVK